MKLILRDVIPPFVLRSLLKMRGLIRNARASVQTFEFGVEQPPEFYDRNYEKGVNWKKHYTNSPYYPMWTVIADRIRRTGVEKILDIGCGPGQVACLLRDIGVAEYKGLDFSTARVERARSVCPEFEFFAANALEDNLIDTYHYDCVLMIEFLEHIDNDIGVINRIHPGATVLATVPNFPAAAHVRHFDCAKDVETRYGPLFKQVEVATVLANEHGKNFYILQGTRGSDKMQREDIV